MLPLTYEESMFNDMSVIIKSGNLYGSFCDGLDTYNIALRNCSFVGHGRFGCFYKNHYTLGIHAP